MKSTWFEGKLSQFGNDLDFVTEEKILQFNEKVVNKMVEKGITRVELAKRLGVSKPFVTKLLNGNPNMTMKTMVNISMALDCNIDFDLYHKWLKPKTFYLVSDSNFTHYEPNIEGYDYASAA
jgi:transcriptional regulator with XRE-family HTH domain